MRYGYPGFERLRQVTPNFAFTIPIHRPQKLAKVKPRLHRGSRWSEKMHMLLARSALVRGMQLVAGMLPVMALQDAKTKAKKETAPEFNLVSWTSTAQSRREDELARSRLSQTGT
jgi:hypothetical protein